MEKNAEELKKEEVIKHLAEDEKNELVIMDVDEALEVGGPCGKAQTILQLLFMSACVTVTYHAVEGYFTGNNPSWRCTTRAINGTLTVSAGHVTNSSYRHVANMSSFCTKNYDKIIHSGSVDYYRRCELERSEWEYLTDRRYSYVTEFDLVCDRAVVAAFASGSLYLGGQMGCILTGIIADKYGRKIVMIVSQTFVIIASILCSYAANIWQLTAARIVLGGAQMACYSVGYTAVLEFIAPSYRTASGMMYQMMFCVSQLFIDIVAYYQREWRSLQFYSSFACALSLALFLATPNTPRWLTSKGRDQKAKKVLDIIAMYNGNQLPAYDLKSQSVTKKDNFTYFHLFMTWKMFITTSALSYIWITCALLYFAIALESSSLGGDMYQAFGLTATADLPSYFVALFACNYLGRKRTVLGAIFCAGIFIGSASLVPQTYENKYIVNVTLAMLAKFCTTTAFNGIFLWTFEIYPTVLRSQGSSYCVAWERFGAFVAPFLISVLQSVSYILPNLIMCICALSCAGFGLVLPETIDFPTRESYEDFFKEPVNISEDDIEKNGGVRLNEQVRGCDNRGLDDIVESVNNNNSSSV